MRPPEQPKVHSNGKLEQSINAQDKLQHEQPKVHSSGKLELRINAQDKPQHEQLKVHSSGKLEPRINAQDKPQQEQPKFQKTGRFDWMEIARGTRSLEQPKVLSKDELAAKVSVQGKQLPGQHVGHPSKVRHFDTIQATTTRIILSLILEEWLMLACTVVHLNGSEKRPACAALVEKSDYHHFNLLLNH